MIVDAKPHIPAVLDGTGHDAADFRFSDVSWEPWQFFAHRIESRFLVAVVLIYAVSVPVPFLIISDWASSGPSIKHGFVG